MQQSKLLTTPSMIEVIVGKHMVNRQRDSDFEELWCAQFMQARMMQN